MMIRQTSIDSYEEIKPNIGTIQEQCLNTLDILGVATVNEMCYNMYTRGILKTFCRNSISTRLNELIRNGKVEQLPKRKDTITGRMSYEYRILGSSETKLKVNINYTRDSASNLYNNCINALVELKTANAWDLTKYLYDNGLLLECDKRYLERTLYKLCRDGKAKRVGTSIDEVTNRSVTLYSLSNNH